MTSNHNSTESKRIKGEMDNTVLGTPLKRTSDELDPNSPSPVAGGYNRDDGTLQTNDLLLEIQRIVT